MLLVCPGPIARDEPRQYPAAGSIPERAHGAGAGVKVGALRPEQLATAILAACERRRPELVIPAKSRLLFAISQLSPTLGDWLLRKVT